MGKPPQDDVKQFWVTDYPILCYLALQKGHEKPQQLVFRHLADLEAKEIVVDLGFEENFLLLHHRDLI